MIKFDFDFTIINTKLAAKDSFIVDLDWFKEGLACGEIATEEDYKALCNAIHKGIGFLTAIYIRESDYHHFKEFDAWVSGDNAVGIILNMDNFATIMDRLKMR